MDTLAAPCSMADKVAQHRVHRAPVQADMDKPGKRVCADDCWLLNGFGSGSWSDQQWYWQQYCRQKSIRYRLMASSVYDPFQGQ